MSDLPNKVLNILIADDDDGDRKQIKRALKQAGLHVKCTETESVKEALAACEESTFDCVIVDYRLPGQDGLSGVTALHERLPTLAILMVTGQGDEMIATEAMRRGASDYMPKGLVTAERMGRSVANAIEKAALLRMITKQQEELAVFSRVLVHDLKSPIYSALAFAALIEEDVQEGRSEEAVLYCRRVVGGLKRVGALIDTLHQYTSAENEVVFEPVDMRDVMMDTLSNLEFLVQRRGAQVTYGELPVVLGTPQLTQLLQNLIGNGIKYCEAEVPVVHVSAQPQDGNIWLFLVKDNGIGIAEEHYQQIFEPFNRLHTEDEYDGTGLGLATCKKIVERHGGKISCQSNKGEGTTFFFTLHGA